jgi:3-hydroxy-9,10-secoandrosta-1,3,5(10)-triene-9,17-dione monooxygenase reductase component
VSIHSTDPFATPDDQRSPVRRLRGRLPSPVTLWTAAGSGAAEGLTVSSTVVGEPSQVLGLLDEESALFSALSVGARFTVMPLGPDDRQLADQFAGLMPAAGGLFQLYEWSATEWGPVLAGRDTWAGCRVAAIAPFGWSMLVQATIEHVSVGADGGAAPLIHYRGRYHRLGDR